MHNIKLSKQYSLLIPLKLDSRQIADIIENKLTFKIRSQIGLNDSYSISIADKCNNFIGNLYIDILRIKGIWITKITQKIEGALIHDKEIYENECDLLLGICNVVEGLFVCKEHGIKDSISYAINYKSNTIESKLIETLIDEIQDPLETFALVQILKNKKNELSSIFECYTK